jgi:hypothetical protein
MFLLLALHFVVRKKDMMMLVLRLFQAILLKVMIVMVVLIVGVLSPIHCLKKM